MTYLKYLILLLIPIYSNAQNFVIDNGKRKGSEKFKIKSRANFIDIVIPSDLDIYTKSPINVILKKGDKIIKSVFIKSDSSSLRLEHNFTRGFYNLSFKNSDVDKSITIKRPRRGRGYIWTGSGLGALLFYYFILKKDATPPLPDPPLPGSG
tara:strand:+ start:394 stop:849 length:456 start_codon:yes stop_codon:yes gene_type:complete